MWEMATGLVFDRRCHALYSAMHFYILIMDRKFNPLMYDLVQVNDRYYVIIHVKKQVCL